VASAYMGSGGPIFCGTFCTAQLLKERAATIVSTTSDDFFIVGIGLEFYSGLAILLIENIRGAREDFKISGKNFSNELEIFFTSFNVMN
jgi:hypothetical protein